MPKWLEQAAKNDLEIIEDGQCQLCGSDTLHGITECVATAGKITHKISQEKGIEHMTIFLCVDAHALQHTQIHARWNNHFHLTRLHLILVDEIDWDYDLTTVLNEVLDDYKLEHPQEKIQEPDEAHRAKITVTDVDASHDEEEYIDLVWEWAEQVYASFADSHVIARRVAEQFKQRMLVDSNEA
ncbi:hypothetical protein H8K35_00755 [Undibacterium sp. LX40W]|uniref:Uncharacterized protein n=1 Tax=Undibacterium nitidum TaxID=2762298 RepID=A0A923HKJ1_9BURK|nr:MULTISPECIES: DUF5946 family protein [Undibacterium]MBC3881089.1 hypothetical protein [Undibacterium nitidum]MBC3890178.1 hypothetical protein [Undibacterium sp. LX40W]